MKYDSHREALEIFADDKHAEHDLRGEINEQIAFIHNSDGQWESDIWAMFEQRPRYTFDLTNPAIEKVWAEMAANEFAAMTDPVGDGADEKKANLINGLLRSIYNNSKFDDISSKAGKRMIGTGFSAWEVDTGYIGEAFYQDIIIKPLYDAENRVWFDSASELQTREDAMHCTVLDSVHSNVLKDRYKDRDGVFSSLTDSRSCSTQLYKPKGMIQIGRMYYRESYKKTIFLMQDGSTSSESAGAIDEREVTAYKVYCRRFDNNDWLDDDPRETVFSYIPIVPQYAHFEIVEGKIVYHGVIRGMMDPQRVFNYSESKKVEDSVLARGDKIFMTPEQTRGLTGELGNLNRDPRSVARYNHVDGQSPPYIVPGTMPQPALTELSENMKINMQLNLNMPNAMSEIEASRRDSDFRADQRNSIGQMGTFEYYRSHKTALEHTAKIIVNAIPRVYDVQRAVTIIDEAGQSSQEVVNQNQNGVTDNDLTVGRYDVTIKIGKDMQSRKADANDGILRLGEYNPDVVVRNSDILASNIDAPGMQAVADRERSFLMQQGVIPQSQWTEDEKQAAMQAAQQPKEQDPASKIAEAELKKTENQAMAEQYKALGKQAELELQQAKLQQDAAAQSFKQDMDRMKLEIERDRSDFQNLLDAYKSLESAVKSGTMVDNRVLNEAEENAMETSTGEAGSVEEA